MRLHPLSSAAYTALFVMFAGGVGLMGCAASTAPPSASPSGPEEPTPVSSSSPSPTASDPLSSGTDDPSTESTPMRADVFVSIATIGEYDGDLEITGVVAGIVEDDGSCTATLRLGDTTVRADSVPATAGNGVTYCGLLSIPVADLREGSWNVTLSYESSTSAGSSAPEEIVIG